jgi:hypothetical protein
MFFEFAQRKPRKERYFMGHLYVINNSLCGENIHPYIRQSFCLCSNIGHKTTCRIFVHPYIRQSFWMCSSIDDKTIWRIFIRFRKEDLLTEALWRDYDFLEKQLSVRKTFLKGTQVSLHRYFQIPSHIELYLL